MTIFKKNVAGTTTVIGKESGTEKPNSKSTCGYLRSLVV